MCGSDAWYVDFAPNQILPAPYLVEGYDGTYYGCTLMGEWIGPNRKCRFEARRDALAQIKFMKTKHSKEED